MNGVDGGRRLVYRLLIAVDIERYSRRRASEQLQAQEQLRHVLNMAAARSDLDRDGWLRQVRGDGELAVLPDDVDVPQVVGRFTTEMSRALRELNERLSPATPVRMRVALHHGTLTAGPFGPAGDAPIVVSRLLDAQPLRRQLADDPARDLVLIVSEPLYQDVVATGFCTLAPDRFRSIRITSKGVAYRGHIYQGDLPEHAAGSTNILVFPRPISAAATQHASA